MSGLNRKSSYQIAESILDGEIRTLTRRQLRFLAESLVKLRERECSCQLELKLHREKLNKVEFKQHELESIRRDLRNLKTHFNRNRIRRRQYALPEDAIQTPFALFGWTDLPMGGWSDCLGTFASKAAAEKRKQELRGQWRNLYIVDVRAEQVR